MIPFKRCSKWKTGNEMGKSLFLLLCLTLLLEFGCGSKTIQLAGHWRDRDITIDGLHEEWQERMTFIEKENVSVGTFNDSEFFYLSLVTNNRDLQRQIMFRGFTLWFDPDGGKDRTFGIRFPLGMHEMGFMIRGGRPPGRDMESFEENFEKSLVSLEIIDPDREEPQMMFVSELQGIELKLDRSKQTFVYEVKVPLEATEDRPFAINSQTGQTIGLGFEVAEFNRDRFKDRMGPGNGGARPPGGIGGRPGGLGGPGRNGPGRPQMPETFKLWVSVPLVTSE